MELDLKTYFRDRVVVITGGAGVICSSLALAYASLGAKVAILERTIEKGKELEQKLTNLGYTAKSYYCDVLDKKTIKIAHESVLRDLGKCDILINGAGGNNPLATTDNEFATNKDLTDEYKSFFDLEESGVTKVFNLNFLGSFLPSQEFAKDMIETGKGNILNISSMNAYTPLTKIPAYSAAKAGVSNFTEWLATYFAKVNIRVNAIAPGFFITVQNKSLLLNDDGSLKERSKKIINSTPMERFGKVDELIGATLFLTNNELSSFITGVVLPIDGGFNAYHGV